ncbi:hypothetical protein [Bacillus toyonensis]|uniref:hypothetical protein n=1 Tax=Bacillus toyonensis TaxID=155322 RepID=UPI0027155A79|nr:hypothetical protein [Bacillus toyonensis]
MIYMYVIYSLDAFGEKYNVSVVKSEEDAKKAIVGLMKNGLIAGYEQVEVWSDEN